MALIKPRSVVRLHPSTPSLGGIAIVAQLVRALPCHGRGCRFKSGRSRRFIGFELWYYFNVLDFLKHLRLNYNFLILSGPFLLGGLFSPRADIIQFVIQFLSVYIFLFGGANAYNSYWDKDEGPIGGLEHPPKMRRWMLSACWIFQSVGLLIAFISGPIFIILYLISVLFFWLYSSPNVRWKGRPFLSFVAIGVSTVFCSFIFGYISFGGKTFDWNLIVAMLGATCLILSMYPISQLYQIKTDKERGDTTFAVSYGLKGVKISFTIFFCIGIILLSFSFLKLLNTLTFISLVLGILLGVYFYATLRNISSSETEYKKIMKLKYLGGLGFSLSMLMLLCLGF